MFDGQDFEGSARLVRLIRATPLGTLCSDFKCGKFPPFTSECKFSILLSNYGPKDGENRGVRNRNNLQRPIDVRAFGTNFKINRFLTVFVHRSLTGLELVMTTREKGQAMGENDGLPLEYKLNQGRAGRQANACDFVNDTLGQSERGVFGLGLQEELFNLGLRQLRAFTNNRSDL